MSSLLSPARLDRASIAALIPHQGPMCLLDGVLDWDDEAIRCISLGHASTDHPLRCGSVLPSSAAIEYASQAMAVHGSLKAPGVPPRPGFLAAARQVVLHRPHLHDIRGPLLIEARVVAGDDLQAIYQFSLLTSEGDPVAQGRATVVLQAHTP